MENRFCVVPTEESILTVQAQIESFMDEAMVPMKVSMKTLIVVDEIYSNIVRYSGAKEAEIICSIDEDKLELIFTDDGIPYDPTGMKDPEITGSAEERDIGGLGVFISKKLMDKFEYEYSEGKNHLRMLKIIQ